MEKMTNVKALEFVLENCELPAEIAEKVTKIADSYRNKSANRKPTANQQANEVIKDAIVAVLGEATKPMTISEIQEADDTLKELSNQRMSALLTQLGAKGTGVVVKTMDKKKAYFSLA
jgi:predicted negative regulator of RcsB-dependent stress response